MTIEWQEPYGVSEYYYSFYNIFILYSLMQTILVTGGTGLVGRGIQLALERTKEDGKQKNENWIFLSSKDCNLL